jgi:hypothetical protein
MNHRSYTDTHAFREVEFSLASEQVLSAVTAGQSQTRALVKDYESLCLCWLARQM